MCQNLLNAKPNVSVILTVYNHEKFVKEAIESVLNQSYSNFELIIINDGSTDKSKDVINQFQNRSKILIKHVHHIGRAKSLNLGFEMAKGEFIAIIDSDDIYHPEKLQKQVSYLESHPNIVMVGCHIVLHNLLTGEKELFKPPNDSKKIKRKLILETVFPFPAVMIRKKVIHDVGLCNSKLLSKIDLDLFGKIGSKGMISVVPESLVTINVHESNYFKTQFSAEHHRKTRLKIRWLNLWRLKANYLTFMKILLWLCFEYIINLFPIKIRHLLPHNIRAFTKILFNPK